jgi:hypothetical protein
MKWNVKTTHAHFFRGIYPFPTRTARTTFTIRQEAHSSRRSGRHASSVPLSFKTMLLMSCSACHNSVNIDTRRKVLPAITDKLGSSELGGAAAALPSRFEYREM